MKFVIEHLDPEVFEWSMIEYKHISEVVGRDKLIFCNTDDKKLEVLGKVESESIVNLKLDNVCVLDPNATQTLKSSDKFDYYVFGGVLGDEPMQNRTEKEISGKLKCETRNLGKDQMSTDTAVLVTTKILDGEWLTSMKFQKELEIVIDNGESVILPFTYLVENNIVVLPKGLIEHIVNNPGF